MHLVALAVFKMRLFESLLQDVFFFFFFNKVRAYAVARVGSSMEAARSAQ